MSQNINLFNPALRKTRDRLSARNLAAATALVSLAVAAFALYTQYRVDQMATEAHALDAQLKAQQAQLAEISGQLAQRKPDARLAAEVTQAEALLAARKDVVATLQSGAIGKTEGFSETMRALARQSVGGLWLTAFSIASGGSEMEIRGRVLNPELVAVYVRRLNAEKVFQGRSFAALEMKGVAQEPVSKPVADAPRKADDVSSQPKPLPSHIEFSLASMESASGVKPGAERRP